jgi:hypothetical protein
MCLSVDRGKVIQQNARCRRVRLRSDTVELAFMGFSVCGHTIRPVENDVRTPSRATL